MTPGCRGLGLALAGEGEAYGGKGGYEDEGGEHGEVPLPGLPALWLVDAPIISRVNGHLDGNRPLAIECVTQVLWDWMDTTRLLIPWLPWFVPVKHPKPNRRIIPNTPSRGAARILRSSLGLTGNRASGQI
jgi:hypothetical protein